MDFFASQELARRNTRRLVVLLVVTLVCLIGSIYLLAVLIANSIGGSGTGAFHLGHPGLFNLPLLATVTGVVSAIVGGGSALKIAELRGGGPRVAQMLGGRRLQPDSRDPAERRVLNVVEEMAIASGTPVPPVYILDNEPGINAFAAGHTIDDAVIGLNRGTIDQLSRDELQGVIAHEFSHILNGDMRMSLRMIGILHGIQAIALIGWGILRAVGNGSVRRSSSNSKGDGGVVLIVAIGAGLLVLGSVGLFFARLIKASVSRQREFLADASAVQFTRNPEGIAGALKTIGAASQHSKVVAAQAETISHMFFANMSGSLMAGLLATHPPLLTRIQRIEPSFQGDFGEWIRSRRRRQEEEREGDREARETMDRFGFPRMGGFPLNPAILVGAIGAPTEDDVEFSRMLVGQVPRGLIEACRDVFLARCVAFAFLLDRDAGLRQRQLEYLAGAEGQGTVDETVALEKVVVNTELRWRLPLFEIIQGTLTGMSPPQFQRFRSSLFWLIEADQRITLFEFFTQHHLITHLDRHFGLRGLEKTRFESLAEVAGDAAMLLEMVARHGNASPDASRAAYAAGLGQLPEAVRGQMEYAATTRKVSELNSAIARLALSAPAVRKEVLLAAAATITNDRAVTVAEAELFRALAESLDCPVPPLIASVNDSRADRGPMA